MSRRDLSKAQKAALVTLASGPAHINWRTAYCLVPAGFVDLYDLSTGTFILSQKGRAWLLEHRPDVELICAESDPRAGLRHGTIKCQLNCATEITTQKQCDELMGAWNPYAPGPRFWEDAAKPRTLRAGAHTHRTPLTDDGGVVLVVSIWGECFDPEGWQWHLDEVRCEVDGEEREASAWIERMAREFWRALPGMPEALTEWQRPSETREDP